MAAINPEVRVHTIAERADAAMLDTLVARADVVLFGNFQTIVDKQGKAAGGENRILCCSRTAAYDAKNRVGLPDVLDMGGSPQEAWRAFAAALVAGKQTKEEGK